MTTETCPACCRPMTELRGSDGFDGTVCRWCEAAELAAAQRIIARLPLTADGVPVVCGDTVYAWVGAPREVRPFVVYNLKMAWANAGGWVLLSNCYSTREAALAAGKETK